MNITRSQSILSAVILLAVFFGIAFLYAGRESRPAMVKQEEAAPSAQQERGEPHFTLNDFERSETKNGRKIWEVKGRTAEYFPQSNTARVTNANLWFFRGNGDIIRLDADSASIELRGSELKSADLSGSVVVNVENRSVRMETDRAIYNKDDNTVVAPGVVRMTSEMFDLSGTSLVAHLDTSIFVLEKDVQSIVKKTKVKQ